jgi:hypothetical protein
MAFGEKRLSSLARPTSPALNLSRFFNVAGSDCSALKIKVVSLLMV